MAGAMLLGLASPNFAAGPAPPELRGLGRALWFVAARLWPLAWIGIVPLFLAMRGQRRPLRLGWLYGAIYYAVVLYWISPTISRYTVISPLVATLLMLLLATAAGLFIGGWAWVVEKLASRGVSRLISAPAIWLVLEWSRTFFPAAFPWGFIGYSQFSSRWMIQFADLGGVYLVSGTIVLVNALLAESVAGSTDRRTPKGSRWRLLTAAAAIVAAVAVYGGVRVSQIETRETTGQAKIGIAQGNIDQAIKWDATFQEQTLSRYESLSTRLLSEGARLIVWPEASVPFFLQQDPRRARLTDFARDQDVHLLVGSPGWEQEGEIGRQYNRAWSITPSKGLDRSYDKIQLVPFGEFVPWGGLFGLVQKAVEGVGDFGRGTEHVVFEHPVATAGIRASNLRYSALICYEAIFADLTRQFVRDGADVLINLSNDAWYGKTAAPWQLLAMIGTRSVENRVPMIRATNTGVSALIDPSGRVLQPTALYEETAVTWAVDIRETGSFYSRFGNWIVGLSSLALGAAILLAHRRRPV